MNKIIIPSILGIVILVAGIFAFVPIDEASTVHDIVISNLQGDGGLDLDDIDTAIDDLQGDGGLDLDDISDRTIGISVVTAGPFTVDSDDDDGTICLDLDAGEGAMTLLAAHIDTTGLSGGEEILLTAMEYDGDDCDATPSVTFDNVLFDTAGLEDVLLVDVGTAPPEDAELFSSIVLAAQGGWFTISSATDNYIFEIDVSNTDGFTYTIDFIVETEGADTAEIVEDLP